MKKNQFSLNCRKKNRKKREKEMKEADLERGSMYIVLPIYQ